MQKERFNLVAGLYGNALEWYDFLLYASFAPIFAQHFFPAEVPIISLMVTFAVFAVGFIARPIGGTIISHYADSIGRQKALVVSVTIMTVATALIAFLPNYEQAGLFGPVLFILLRIVQGIAVGAELPNSATFLVEHVFESKRGFAGSLVLSTAFLGIFFGAFVALILSEIFTYDYLAKWGWRYAYIIGAILGILGIYLRVKAEETKNFKRSAKVLEPPFKVILKEHKITLLLAIAITSVLAVGNYIVIAFATSFLVEIRGFSLKDALVINFVAILLLTILIPIMGMLSDSFGRKPILKTGLWGLVFTSFMIFFLLIGGSFWQVLFAELLLAVVIAPLNAVVPTIIAELFPTSIRASGSAIGYNIGQALFGGTMPLVAFGLIGLTRSNWAPAWYLFSGAFVVAIVTTKLKETYKTALAD